MLFILSPRVVDDGHCDKATVCETFLKRNTDICRLAINILHKILAGYKTC